MKTINVKLDGGHGFAYVTSFSKYTAEFSAELRECVLVFGVGSKAFFAERMFQHLSYL